MNSCVFTCNFGDKDDLKEPEAITPGVDFICFTNNPDLKSTRWKIEFIDRPENIKLSRFFKIIPPSGYDQTLYLDSSFKIKRDLTKLLSTKTEGIWLFKHPQRNCAYDEAKVVIDKKLDNLCTVSNQIKKYGQEGFPRETGLWRCGIVIRDSRNAKIQELNRLWMEEIKHGSWRDQISFPYVCWKTNVRPRPIMGTLSDYYFEQSLHKPYFTKDWKCVGKGSYNADLIEKHPLVHLIVTESVLYFPKWLNNYISLKFGRDRFIELTKALNGVVVYE
jgi:hypothetical protein